MNYTEKYHLPQWEETDRVMRKDFNQMCVDLEAGLAKTAQDAASNLPYAIGTYTGTGNDLTIALGFRPRFLIVSSQPDASSVMQIEDFTQYGAITGGNTIYRRVQFTENGFVVKAKEYYEYPDLTVAGRVYDYIAFK